MESFNIHCPQCNINIAVPFWRELEVRALDEADLAETTARQELSDIKGWLHSVSLFGLLKFWRRR